LGEIQKEVAAYRVKQDLIGGSWEEGEPAVAGAGQRAGGVEVFVDAQAGPAQPGEVVPQRFNQPARFTTAPVTL